MKHNLLIKYINKMKKIILVICLVIIGKVFISCTKEESELIKNKSEKIIPKMASPEYEAMLKKLAKFIGSLLDITIDIKSGYYYAVYYPNGNLYKEGCNPGDAICKFVIHTGVSNSNPDISLNCLIGKNDKGELICCMNEGEDQSSFDILINSEGLINLTSDIIIDDEQILSRFGYSEPIVIEKGNIPYQKIGGITFINLGIH